MKSPEDKIQFKNHFFKLGQGRLIPSTDVQFWQIFWCAPRDAADIFDLLTAFDVQTVRDQNLPNLLVFVRVLCSTITQLSDSPTKRDHRAIRNCVRFLTKLLPFVFELKNYRSEIEPSLFLSNHFDPLHFSSSTQAPPTASVLSKASSNAPTASSVNATTLVSCLVKLLFLDGFTIEPALAKSATTVLRSWEPGIGNFSDYQSPDPLYDCHRIDVLRLLLTLVSTSFYDKLSDVVSAGNSFLTVLVAGIPKNDFNSLVCSLTNLVCRSGRIAKGNSGLEYDHQSLVSSRYLLVVSSSQLLAAMLVYAMPSADHTRLLHQNGLLPNSASYNRTRSFFARISKDQDLNFLSSHLLGIVRGPLVAVESAGKQKLYKNVPSPMAESAMVIYWELMQCNRLFRRLTTERVALKLIPCILYHIFAFHDVSQHSHSVKTAAYFLLYLCSQEPLVKASILTMPMALVDSFPPEFRSPGPISTRDFIIVHTSRILSALITFSGTRHSKVPIHVKNFLLPTLVETLYNIIPCINSSITGTDSAPKGMANLNSDGGLSYAACSAIAQVLVLFSTKQFLIDAPGNAEMLALLLRAICAASVKSPKACRMLYYSILENESTYNNIWTTINSLDNKVFCVGSSKLMDVQEDEDMDVQDNTSENYSSTGRFDTPKTFGKEWGSINNSDRVSERLSIDSSVSEQLSILDTPTQTRLELEHKSGTETPEPEKESTEARDLEAALRPKPPSGMSLNAKEKLPRDTPIKESWGGNEALRVILLVLIPSLKEKLGERWGKQKPLQSDMYRLVKLIESFEMKKVFETHRQELHYDFFPETPIDMVKFSWGYLSLGWYTSMLYWDIYSAVDIIKLFIKADTSFMSNISSSLAAFGKLASSWTGKDSHRTSNERRDAAIVHYVESDSFITNIWANTNTKLFADKIDADKTFNAFGIKFGSTGSATSVNDITSSLVKRFSDFRVNTRSSISSAGSTYSGLEELSEGAKLTKRDSLSSLHSLNTLNRARSNTPRNSISN